MVGLVKEMAHADFDPLSSPAWHRVASWRPRWKDGVSANRVWRRGQRWHVLRAPEGGPACRLDPAAYEIAARLDGRRTLQALWTALARSPIAAQAVEPPSQEHIIDVVTTLQQHGLLAFDQDVAPVNAMAHETAGRAPWATPPSIDDQLESAPTTAQANSLLAWRLRLLDPSRLLARLAPLGRRMFSPPGAALWALLFASLLVGLILHAPALLAHGHIWLSTPRYLLLAALAYPFVKAVHELAHGLAVQRWGGQVHEAGLTFMLLMPVPYVDASAAHGFAKASQRALVSAAGILTELALAAVGLWMWRWSPPGLMQDLGFVVWFIAGVSTVLFNANPLQRLDGYHVLTDVLDLPNLAPRSRQWWLHAASRLASGGAADDQQVTRAPVLALGERPWLIAYAPLAWVYQLGLWCGITWWIGGLSTPLGVAVGALAAARLLLLPAIQTARLLWHGLLWPGSQGAGRAAGLRRVIWLCGLPALAVLLPWPDARLAQGVVWAPDQALVRPQVDGFVLRVHATPGHAVHQGDLLITLDNPRLRADRAQTEARLAQAEQGQFSQMGLDSGKAGQAGDEVRRLSERLAYLDDQIARLQVRAQRDGVLVLPASQDLPGRYLRRGTLLGHVMPPGERPLLRVALHEQDMQELQPGSRAVSVLSADRAGPPLDATLLRESGGAGTQLPAAALSRDMGGDVPTDPQDKTHLRTLRPVVLMDVRLDAPPREGAWPLGARAWVRFDQGWSPPLVQAWRWLRRQVGERFNPAR